jgi:putative DNA primase/helicase
MASEGDVMRANFGVFDTPPPEWDADHAEPIDTSNPLKVARAFLKARTGSSALTNLAYSQGDFWTARLTHYELLTADHLRAELYRWLEKQETEIVVQKKPRQTAVVRVKVNKRMFEGVQDALKAAAHVDVPDAPAWIHDATNMPPAHEILACSNGLLHVPTRKLLPPDRRFFNLNAIDFAYNPHAPKAIHWPAFMRDLWGDDAESIETLQEVFGLTLTGDTTHHKAFLLVGPRRSGKGTIGRILTAMLGLANVTAPTLASIGTQFGKQAMIGKRLALIADARIGGRADVAAIVEDLLRMTGEDIIGVHRKFREDWTGRLRVRFVLLSNELPAFLDQSGALSSRFIVLHMTRSFLGTEDHGLEQRLLTEMPSILLWALDGLDRLRKRGYFRQPKSAVELVRQLETLSSPIKSFVAERCIIAPGGSIECGRLFEAWKEWCQVQNRDHAGTLEVFGRNLGAAFPAIKTTRPRTSPGRRRHYEGIRLRDITDPETDPENTR